MSDQQMGDDGWRKSSYSVQNGCVEWHRCGAGSCVEVGVVRTSHHCTDASCVVVDGLPGGGVAVRDSKDPYGPIRRFNPAEWNRILAWIRNDTFDWQVFEPLDFNAAEREAFLAGVRDGEFELPT